MSGSDISVASRTLRQSFQAIEYTATAIVQQQDTQRTVERSVPKRILIIEETEVADDTIGLFPRQREAGSSRQTALDSVESAVATDVMRSVKTGQTHRHTIGVMHGAV